MTEKNSTVETTSVAATIDALVQKGLVALDKMRQLTQEQVDYIVAEGLCCCFGRTW